MMIRISFPCLDPPPQPTRATPNTAILSLSQQFQQYSQYSQCYLPLLPTLSLPRSLLSHTLSLSPPPLVLQPQTPPPPPHSRTTPPLPFVPLLLLPPYGTTSIPFQSRRRPRALSLSFYLVIFAFTLIFTQKGTLVTASCPTPVRVLLTQVAHHPIIAPGKLETTQLITTPKGPLPHLSSISSVHRPSTLVSLDLHLESVLLDNTSPYSNFDLDPILPSSRRRFCSISRLELCWYPLSRPPPS